MDDPNQNTKLEMPLRRVNHEMCVNISSCTLRCVSVFADCMIARVFTTTTPLEINSETTFTHQLLNSARVRISEWKNLKHISNFDGYYIDVPKNDCSQPFSPSLGFMTVNRRIRKLPKKSTDTGYQDKIQTSTNKSLLKTVSFVASADSDEETSKDFLAQDTESQRKTTNNNRANFQRLQHSSLSRSAVYSTRTGGHYLFHSLPQPTPPYEITEGKGIRDLTHSNWSPLASFPNALEDKQGNGEISACKVSVDRHTLHQITRKEVEVRAALVLSKSRPLMGKNPSTQPTEYSEYPVVTTSGDAEVPNTLKLTSNQAFSDKPAPSPIDLAGYVQSGDLSASFEASMLKSLKEAANRRGALARNLVEEQHSGRSDWEANVSCTNQVETISENIADCGLPTSRQKPDSIGLRARNISFSDEESSMAGVLSIAEFPPPEKPIQAKSARLKGDVNRHQSRTEHTNRQDKYKVCGQSVYKADSLEDASASITTISNGLQNRLTEFQLHSISALQSLSSDDSLTDFSPANILNRTTSEPHLQSLSGEAFPRGNGESIIADESSRQSGWEEELQPDPGEITQSCEGFIDVLYDPILDCYYDPVTGKYYEMD